MKTYCKSRILRMGMMKMKLLLLLPLGMSFAAPSWSEVQYGIRPVNTTQDVPTLEFSKTDFILGIQDCLRKQGVTEALALYDGLPEAHASDADLLVIKASLFTCCTL